METPDVLDIRNLPSVSFDALASLPNVSAIYFVLDTTAILYIGRATSLYGRWRSHARKVFYLEDPCLRLAWVVVKPELLEHTEKIFIDYYKPRDNGMALPTHHWIPHADHHQTIAVQLRADIAMSLSILGRKEGRTLEDQLIYILEAAQRCGLFCSR